MTVFYVGQKVVCVDVTTPNKNGETPPAHELKLNAIYTISDIFVYWSGLGVRLLEVDPAPMLGFHAFRFRPLDEDKAEDSEVVKWARNLCVEIEADNKAHRVKRVGA